MGCTSSREKVSLPPKPTPQPDHTNKSSSTKNLVPTFSTWSKNSKGKLSKPDVVAETSLRDTNDEIWRSQQRVTPSLAFTSIDQNPSAQPNPSPSPDCAAPHAGHKHSHEHQGASITTYGSHDSSYSGHINHSGHYESYSSAAYHSNGYSHSGGYSGGNSGGYSGGGGDSGGGGGSGDSGGGGGDS